MLQNINAMVHSSEDFNPLNRAFLHGDAVKTSFFVRHSELIMAEECYFFLMASMRKMRMNIPLSYTLDFFVNLFTENVLNKGVSDAVITFLAFRDHDGKLPSKSGVSFYFELNETGDILEIQKNLELDMLKEISVNTNLLSNIRVHCPENIYAEVYARENDLDDVILLNPNKRIARSIYGNLLFLQDGVIRIPKQSEGAYISPLMENFVTFVHKNQLASIDQAEIIAFESQKAEEILLISDEKGVFSVTKIRNKTFPTEKFTEITAKWRESFN